jgi:hypothetical protein
MIDSMTGIIFPDTDTLNEKKKPTPFEQRRANARTFEELVALGEDTGMEFPEEWAQRVLSARNRNNYGRL